MVASLGIRYALYGHIYVDFGPASTPLPLSLHLVSAGKRGCTVMRVHNRTCSSVGRDCSSEIHTNFGIIYPITFPLTPLPKVEFIAITARYRLIFTSHIRLGHGGHHSAHGCHRTYRRTRCWTKRIIHSKWPPDEEGSSPCHSSLRQVQEVSIESFTGTMSD